MEDMMAKLSSLLEQKALTKYKDLLEMEQGRIHTLKEQFARFMESVKLITTRLLMNTSHDSVPQ